jgi:hypothetical protein
VTGLLAGLVATPGRIAIVSVTVALWIVLGVAIWRVARRRRSRVRLEAALSGAGLDALHDVLVPDGMGGTLHVEFLLLTPRGLLVVDLWDVAGNIFGGDQMNDWTVMSGARRSTFHNPQGPLYDRVAAVKAVAGEIPVEGRVVFTRRGRFPKGLPRWTQSVDSLLAEFPSLEPATAEGYRGRYREAWDRLRDGTTPGPRKASSSFLSELFPR